jgi:DNA-binding transcriptional regulator YhcF (GntR family)
MGDYDPRKWVQLKQRVIRQIADGTLKPGDAVPVTTTGLSYQTARKALRELVAEGWLLPPTPGYPARVPGGDGLLWRKFRAQVIREIEAGILEPGDELTVKYEAHDAGIHPITAAKALTALVAEGWCSPRCEASGRTWCRRTPAGSRTGCRRPPRPTDGRRVVCKYKEGVKTEDCAVCTCQASGADHTPVESTITYPNGTKLTVRKCSDCGRAC